MKNEKGNNIIELNCAAIFKSSQNYQMTDICLSLFIQRIIEFIPVRRKTIILNSYDHFKNA